MEVSITKLSTIQISQESLSTIERISSYSLPSDYILSLVLCDNTLSQELNKEYRQKDYPTNILSFPLTEHEGEIFINLEKCIQEADNFQRPFENFILFLFIHGVMHLKGYDHGSKMEKAEKAIRTMFNV
jgi:probable rRNA maturation factor